MNEICLVKKYKKAYEIKMSLNGKFLANVNASSLKLFDVENDVQVAEFRDIKYMYHINFSSDSRLLAVKSNDKKTAIYDLEKLELYRLFILKNNSQTQDGEFCFTADDKYILNLVYTDDLLGYISKINIETLQEERFFEGSKYVFNYIQYIKSVDRYLIVGYERISDHGDNVSFVMWYSDKDNSFERINLDFDVQQIIYHENTNTFVGWDYGTKKIKIILSDSVVKSKYKVINDEDGYMVDIAFSNNGKYLAVVLNKVVKIYEYTSFKHICSINNENNLHAEFSPNDKQILIGAWGSGCIYNLNFENI